MRKLVIRGRASRCNKLLIRREGVKLQKEVEPQRPERPPRNSPTKASTAQELAAEMNIQGGPASELLRSGSMLRRPRDRAATVS